MQPIDTLLEPKEVEAPFSQLALSATALCVIMISSVFACITIISSVCQCSNPLIHELILMRMCCHAGLSAEASAGVHPPAASPGASAEVLLGVHDFFMSVVCFTAFQCIPLSAQFD